MTDKDLERVIRLPLLGQWKTLERHCPASTGAIRSRCRPVAMGYAASGGGDSHHARTAHDGFRLLADLAGHCKRIALLKFRQEQLH